MSSPLDFFHNLICPLKSLFWRQFFPCRPAYISRVCLGGEERTATKIINFSEQSQVMQEVYYNRPFETHFATL